MSLTIIGFLTVYGIETILFILSWLGTDFLYVFNIYADFMGIASGTLLAIPIAEHLLSLILQEKITTVTMNDRYWQLGVQAALSFGIAWVHSYWNEGLWRSYYMKYYHDLAVKKLVEEAIAKENEKDP